MTLDRQRDDQFYVAIDTLGGCEDSVLEGCFTLAPRVPGQMQGVRQR